MSDTVDRMNDVIYHQKEWRNPPVWPPAYRRWKKAATAELHRLFELRCREVADERIAEHEKALALKLALNDPIARSFRDMFGNAAS